MLKITTQRNVNYKFFCNLFLETLWQYVDERINAIDFPYNKGKEENFEFGKTYIYEIIYPALQQFTVNQVIDLIDAGRFSNDDELNQLTIAKIKLLCPKRFRDKTLSPDSAESLDFVQEDLTRIENYLRRDKPRVAEAIIGRILVSNTVFFNED